jgi:hypothetical protein
MQTKFLPDNLKDTNVDRMIMLKQILRNMMWGCGKDSPASRQVLVTDPYEHNNETLNSIGGREFLQQPNGMALLKTDSSLWSSSFSFFLGYVSQAH